MTGLVSVLVFSTCLAYFGTCVRNPVTISREVFKTAEECRIAAENLWRDEEFVASLPPDHELRTEHGYEVSPHISCHLDYLPPQTAQK